MGQDNTHLRSIKPGLPVYGIDGEGLGTVEAVAGDKIRLPNHTIPAIAVARVDEAGIHLHIARAAFAAAPPETAAETAPRHE